jgi:hypothetical protein
MARKRRQRRCRICKKSPIWIGGDVKNPGPVCKQCYHLHAWPDRVKRQRQKVEGADTPEPDEVVMPTKLGSNLRPSRTERWNRAMTRYQLTLEELAMAQLTDFEPRLMHEVATGRRPRRSEKLPHQAPAEQCRKVRREIRERYAAAIENNKGLLLPIKLSLTLPADLVARIQSQCTSEGLNLGDEIRGLLEMRFPNKTSSPTEAPSEPLTTQPSQSPQSRPRPRFVVRKGGKSAA